MTDEKLDQILKQALTPEIDDSEIQVRRKGRKRRMTWKTVVASGLVACAAVAFVVTGGYFGIFSKSEGGRTTIAGLERSDAGTENSGTVTESDDAGLERSDAGTASSASGKNLFAITAYAAELPEGITSGDVVGLNRVSADYGSAEYLDGRFMISGQNIEKIRISTDKCNLYTATLIYKGDAEYTKAQEAEANGTGEYVRITDAPLNSDETDTSDEAAASGSDAYHYEHLEVAGSTYEGVYNDHTQFGMSVPKEQWSTSKDDQQNYHENVDQVNGATLTIEVSFSDGTSETHHYRVNVGKIFVSEGKDGYLQWDNLTRFLTAEEEAGETPNVYGYLLERVD